MDNARVDVTSEGADALQMALTLAFRGHHASHWQTDPARGLILFWTDTSVNPAPTPFLMPLRAEEARTPVLAWLDAHPASTKDLDVDGEITQGWRVYQDAWGHVGPYWQALCAIQPIPAMHGK